jgi:glucose-6-phosphate dehydrogenase assembly protein OpcA
MIDIAGNYGSLGKLPVFLTPLLAADLPSVLWIHSGRLLERPIRRELTAIASKTVLDSMRMPDARKALAMLAELSAAGVVLGDLAWTRLTRFRAVLWRAFESRKRLDELQRVSALRVISGGNTANTAAWYMGAWVLNSLEAAGLRAELQISTDAGAAPGVLRLEMRGTDLDTVFELCEQRLRLQLGSTSNCVSLPDATETDLMREELGIVRQDEVFERALATAALRAAAA